jgi:hypothetical protein
MIDEVQKWDSVRILRPGEAGASGDPRPQLAEEQPARYRWRGLEDQICEKGNSQRNKGKQRRGKFVTQMKNEKAVQEKDDE